MDEQEQPRLRSEHEAPSSEQRSIEARYLPMRNIGRYTTHLSGRRSQEHADRQYHGRGYQD
ncbi:hypothetical protein FJZ21_04100 [Candidatus Pacearchaeota archaeon]|nr:hypothetical protein [Candidatus Pacearchaeota archaeon]